MNQKPGTPSFRTKTIAISVAACFAATPLTTIANPLKPTVVAGQATFQQNGSTLTVTNTPGTIINWQTFNIDRGEITRFVQQSTSSQVLNRVTGSADPSRILGTLQSNGRVFLINPNGIAFGAGARVDVAGLLVSTLPLSNEDFLANRLKFGDATTDGMISNAGTIATPGGGEIVLVAPRIENSGIIQAEDGRILLAAGKSVEIADLDHPDIRVTVTNSEQQAVNLGQLMANSISLVGGLVRNEGLVEATSAALGEGGRIVLKGLARVETTADSKLDTSGTQAGSITIEAGNSATLSGKILAGASTSGGAITATAPTLELQGAEIRADGINGGGTVLIGGEWQGGGTLVHARQLTVDAASTLSADATDSGNGGTIVLWSDEKTVFQGTATARGGLTSGGGGRVEVSSKQVLGVYGSIDPSSRAGGKGGEVLFDPFDAYISQNSFTPPDGTDQVILTSTIEGITNAGNSVTVTAGNDITLMSGSPINTDNVAGAGGDIQLHAGRSIILNDSIDTDGGKLILSANEGGANRGTGAAQIFQADGTQLITGGGAFSATLNAAGGSLPASGTTAIRLVDVSTNGVDSGTPGVSAAQFGGAVEITAAGGDINILGTGIKALGADGAGGTSTAGGANGGDGGAVTISAPGGRIVVTNADIDSWGGAGGPASATPPGDIFNGGNGGNGSAISLTAADGIILTNADIHTSGGTGGASTTSGNGGNGGHAATITLQVTNDNKTIAFASGAGSTALFAEGGTGGGAGGSGSSGTTGNGGNVTIGFSGSGTIEIDNHLSIYAGGNGSGGTISLSAVDALSITPGAAASASFYADSETAPIEIEAGTDLTFNNVSMTAQSSLDLFANNDIQLLGTSSLYVYGNVQARAGRSLILDNNIDVEGGNSLTLIANESDANGVDAAKRADGPANITMSSSATLDTTDCPDGCFNNAGNITVELRDGAGRSGAKATTGSVTLGILTLRGGETSSSDASAGDGGTLTIKAHDADITVASISTVAQDPGAYANQAGGRGGNVTIEILNASAPRTLEVTGSTNTSGSAGYSDFGAGSSGMGGNGGNVMMKIAGSGTGHTLSVGDITTSGGSGGSVYAGTGGTGGNAGTINLWFGAGVSGLITGSGDLSATGGAGGTFGMSGSDGVDGAAAQVKFRADAGNLSFDSFNTTGSSFVAEAPGVGTVTVAGSLTSNSGVNINAGSGINVAGDISTSPSSDVSVHTGSGTLDIGASISGAIVTLATDDGAIVHSNAGASVSGTKLSLSATTGIGDSGAPVLANLPVGSLLEFDNSGTGDVFINQTSSAPLVVRSGNATAGDITLTAEQLELDGLGNVVAGGNITYVVDYFSTNTTNGLGQSTAGTAIKVTPYTGGTDIKLDADDCLTLGGAGCLASTYLSETIFDAPRFTLETTGQIKVVDDSGALPPLRDVNLGFTSGKTVELLASNGATLDTTLSTDGAKLVINAGSAGVFTNNAGASAIDTGTGDYLIYSANPANDTLGGLLADFTQYNAIFGSTTVLGSGNGLLYSLAPSITAALAGTASKQYDGTLAASLSSSNYSVTGTLGSDVVSISQTSAVYDNANVGTAKIVNAAGLSATAEDVNGKPVYGYTLTNSTASASIGTITQAPLTISTSDVSRQYDGTLAAAGTAIVTAGTLYNNASNGGALDSVSGGTFAFANANAGTGKTVTVAGVTVSDGNAGGNYAVSYASNTSSTITQAPLTVSTSDVSRQYDGTLAAAGTAIVTAGTLYNNASNGGALDSVSGGTFAFANANAGTGKTVTVAGVTVSDGNAGGNYAVSYASNTNSTITQAPLTISTSDVSRQYDGTLAATGTAIVTAGTLYNNASNGGALDSVSGGTFAFADANAGTGKTVTVAGITVSDGNAGGNYAVSYASNTNSTITQAPLTISTSDVSRQYDGTTTAAGTAIVTAGTLYNNASNAGALDSVSGGTFSFVTPYVGTGKTVTVGGVTVSDGNGGGNYALNYLNNTSSTITADPANFQWSGPISGGNWANPSNWNQGVAPVDGSSVAIAGLTGPLVFNSGSSSLSSLSINSGFAVSGGTFVLGSGTFGGTGLDLSGGTFKLNGGTLVGNVNVSGGLFGGNGTVSGNMSMAGGTLSPGASPGTLSITGDLTLSSTSTVLIELGGTTAGSQFDLINVGGTAFLDGTLDIQSYAGYVPPAGTSYQFMTFGNRSGDFLLKNGLAGMNFTTTSTYLDTFLAAASPGSQIITETQQQAVANLDFASDDEGLLHLVFTAAPQTETTEETNEQGLPQCQ